MQTIKDLTRAEEEVMQILWQAKGWFVKDILEELQPPKPAYNTVSTIVRILESKGFVGHKAYGKTHEYFPLVSKESYRKMLAQKMVKSYFNGSVKNLVSFFVQDETIDIKEADEIIKLIEQSKNEIK